MDGVDEAFKATTLFHEIAHGLCGHLPVRTPCTYISSRFGLDIQTKEFEAESCSWLICKVLGIESPSAKYLNGYLDANDKIPPGISIETILKVAGRLEELVKGISSPTSEALRLASKKENGK